MIVANGNKLDLDLRNAQQGADGGLGKGCPVAGHTGRVVDQIRGNVGAEGLRDLLLDEEHLGEVVGGVELLG